MILLVVDMQKGIVDDELYAFDSFMEKTVRLVDAARKNGVEVIFVQHDAGENTGLSVGDEAFEIIDELSPEPGEQVFVKKINSCFGNKDFREYMEKQEDRRLMIIGLQTNYCIDCTVKSAFERGFEVMIPEGTNTTFDNDYMTGETCVRYYNEDVWEELVDIVSVEEAIDMFSSK
ncbi:MAG: isochorismatase family protein [Clostridia bacterium]|jgi:nicotinamidase-related amidase|nr:isochorismatase family protein [Clostridia bacterium]MBR6822042.1 isochorismatase family protein [Clostridia bacterium]